MLMLLGGSLPAASYKHSPTKARPESPPRIEMRVQLLLAWAGGCLPLHRRRGGNEGVGGMWAALELGGACRRQARASLAPLGWGRRGALGRGRAAMASLATPF